MSQNNGQGKLSAVPVITAELRIVQTSDGNVNVNGPAWPNSNDFHLPMCFYLLSKACEIMAEIAKTQTREKFEKTEEIPDNIKKPQYMGPRS